MAVRENRFAARKMPFPSGEFGFGSQKLVFIKNRFSG
jgi:hypothetical protein